MSTDVYEKRKHYLSGASGSMVYAEGGITALDIMLADLESVLLK